MLQVDGPVKFKQKKLIGTDFEDLMGEQIMGSARYENSFCILASSLTCSGIQVQRLVHFQGKRYDSLQCRNRRVQDQWKLWSFGLTQRDDLPAYINVQLCTHPERQLRDPFASRRDSSAKYSNRLTFFTKTYTMVPEMSCRELK
jgi:hypothetical protein